VCAFDPSTAAPLLARAASHLQGHYREYGRGIADVQRAAERHRRAAKLGADTERDIFLATHAPPHRPPPGSDGKQLQLQEDLQHKSHKPGGGSDRNHSIVSFNTRSARPLSTEAPSPASSHSAVLPPASLPFVGMRARGTSEVAVDNTGEGFRQTD